MKKVLLTLAALALVATPSFAYIGGSTLKHTDNAPVGHEVGLGVLTPPVELERRHKGGDDSPTRPVPEPGTMALASMGLLALGVAGRKRRGN